jgi:hypothetical protein
MSVTATRTTTIAYTIDVVGTEVLVAGANAVSPGQITPLALAIGFNSIAVPSLVGITATAVTIIPPVGNTNSLTLKGITGDTGIRLHNTDHTVLALDPSATAIGITVGTAITNVRFMWT